MGKKNRIKPERRDQLLWEIMSVHLTGKGLLCTVPLKNLTSDLKDEVRAVLKNHIRDAGIWDKLVELYDEQGATRMLDDCRVETLTSLYQKEDIF